MQDRVWNAYAASKIKATYKNRLTHGLPWLTRTQPESHLFEKPYAKLALPYARTTSGHKLH